MENIIDWLLEGDVSLQYQTGKYLLGKSREELSETRQRIQAEGWGTAFLERRQPSGHWGRDFYQVKWISTHYTLLDLRYLEIEPISPIRETLEIIFDRYRAKDGSINESRTGKSGDVCINGMVLNYAAFFGVEETQLRSLVDFLLLRIMPDGGFNCQWQTKGTIHSSMHTTISVLEGFNEFIKAGHHYRLTELEQASRAAEEFLLQHRLYKSDKTLEIISPAWTMLSFPSRWKYDILRALLYFADAAVPYDHRMDDAMALLLAKRRKDGTWPVQAKHPGQVHFDMEPTGGRSRFNTLRSLRVLNAYRETFPTAKTLNP